MMSLKSEFLMRQNTYTNKEGDVEVTRILGNNWPHEQYVIRVGKTHVNIEGDYDKDSNLISRPPEELLRDLEDVIREARTSEFRMELK